jgi:spermidine/putrescine transport system permease protein
VVEPSPLATSATARPRTHRPRLDRTFVTVLQLGPGLAWFALLFVGPLIVLVLFSLFTFRESDFSYQPQLTLDNYVSVVTSAAFQAVFLRTVELALVTTSIVVVVAFLFSYVVTFTFPARRQTLYFLVLVTLFGSYLARIYAWRTILGVEGVINTSLLGVGLIDQPIRELLNNPFAVVVALTNFLIPLAVLPIYSAMQNVSPRLLEAGRDLGAGRVELVRRVVMPLVMPGVRVAAAFTFIGAASDYATPTLLGGPTGLMAGGAIVREFGGTLDWPLGAALALTLIAVLIVVIVIISGLLARFAR